MEYNWDPGNFPKPCIILNDERLDAFISLQYDNDILLLNIFLEVLVGQLEQHMKNNITRKEELFKMISYYIQKILGNSQNKI
jgi:hypothetical protein